STNYGQTSPAQSLGAGLTNVSFSVPVSELTGGAVYHYQAVMSNQFGLFAGGDVAFTTAPDPGRVNGFGLNLSVNQSGAYSTPAISNNVLRLTDGAPGEARSVFFQAPQYIGAFKAAFTYQDVGVGGADGVAFVLQNDPRGTSALGGAGGSLGVGASN